MRRRASDSPPWRAGRRRRELASDWHRIGSLASRRSGGGLPPIAGHRGVATGNGQAGEHRSQLARHSTTICPTARRRLPPFTARPPTDTSRSARYPRAKVGRGTASPTPCASSTAWTGPREIRRASMQRRPSATPPPHQDGLGHPRQTSRPDARPSHDDSPSRPKRIHHRLTLAYRRDGG